MSSAPPDLTSRILRHERALVAATLVALTALGWWYVAAQAAGSPAAMGAMRTPPFGALVVMWWLMMAAMMLPSAAPAILLYARVRAMRSRDSAIAESWVFLAGYLLLWLAFSVVAAFAQALTGTSMALGSSVAQAALLIAAGLYQLSPLKSACVSECRSPGQFISRHWRRGIDGAIRLGVRHGLYCLGCCWLLMALLFVGGVMNLLWVVGLTLIVAIEKLAPRGQLVGRAAGIALCVWGGAKLAGF